MSTLAIRRFPDAILKSPTRHVHLIDDRVRRLIEDMVTTMRHQPHCVGLAAPQVGSHLRIAVMDASAHPKASKSRGLLILVNPELDQPEGESVAREGCLSVPDFTGNVRRAKRLRLRAQDERGDLQEWQLEGFEAVVAQHEVDHLGGKLFLDRVTSAGDIFRRKTYL
jgi:peptide deformylase